MSLTSTDHFYSDLPKQEAPLSDLFADESFFQQVPADWLVIITDIEKSTLAVQNGRHELVNLVATGSIIAVLNLAHREGVSIPFFFGGDGATMIIPPSLLDMAMDALHQHAQNAQRDFSLHLRVGHVSVQSVYQKGYALKLSKASMGEVFAIPIVLGDGLVYAEKQVKGEGFDPYFPQPSQTELDLEGMECRWDKIKPPESAHEIVSLLVVARDTASQAVAFKKVLEAIDTIYGPQPSRNPVSISKLELKATLGKVQHEMRVRLGRFDLQYLLKNWAITLFGKLYFRYYKSGKYYLQRLVELSDTLVLDGRINTVISGTSAQRESLTQSLQSLEDAGEIYFGFYVSQESVMSCYVRDREDQHIHFVDGAEGGYTQAARMLKKKLV